jgi:hypothetical protein
MFQRHRSTREQIVRFLERKALRKFNRRIFPSLANRWKTNARRMSRRNHSDPFVRQPARETDTRLREYSTRAKRKIFAALKKVGVLAAKSQHSMSQKQFDSAVRPAPH